MRYFPNSYKKIKPLHLITEEYEPLFCRACGKDILMALFESPHHSANIVSVYKWDEEKNIDYIQDVYCCCKKCDSSLESSIRGTGLMSGWADISDLVIPIEFLRYMFATMNRIRAGNDIYTDEAYKKEINILKALAQKVIRATTDRERERFNELLSHPF